MIWAKGARRPFSTQRFRHRVKYRTIGGVRILTVDLAKTFDSKSAEERWFQQWIDLGYFKADPAREGKVFSVVIPPPNITGQLHLGHALNVSLQDIIVRARRMQGYNTLWLPGTDHAGIATQNAVEKDLAKDGKDRHLLGRDAFIERVWQWRATYGDRILNQLRRLGASCDWSRERFTLDPGLSRAVTKVFVDLYNQGLIYRAKRLINWCPRCETALSDLEVDHKDVAGSLRYIRYPFADGTGAITIATTRPETMLGDTAVAVNPADERYKSYVGKTIRLPLMGREIKIIADAAIDREFGTGALKVTPAHDPVDFELGKRHGLEQIAVLDGKARMNENAGAYRGLSREDARKQIVKDLEHAGLLEKIEPHSHAVGVCSRCDTIVEPMLSEQWFMRTREMADRAIEAVRKGDTTFHPKFWENTFFNWLENIHDWCISRQLWWGHRIPAYRCARCDHLIVAAERPSRCPECDGSDIIQDDDVLDTWFSSGLWPMSTLGWPDDTPELRRYYPTSLLLTGFDIIFFWVARMMMFGLELTDKVPFKDVYITPLVRDELGKKMTKSKGNVVDPLDLMEQYGADAVRFTLAQLAAQGRDVILSHDRFAASRAFANKIWNAARFVMMNLDGAPAPIAKVEIAQAWDWPSDGFCARLDDTIWRSQSRNRRLRIQHRGDEAVPVHLARVLRLVHRAVQGAAQGRRRAASGGAMGAGQRFRQDAAIAASIHAIRDRGNLAGDSAVSGRAKSRGASADSRSRPGAVCRSKQKIITLSQPAEETAMNHCIESDRGDQFAALAARMASGQRVTAEY